MNLFQSSSLPKSRWKALIELHIKTIGNTATVTNADYNYHPKVSAGFRNDKWTCVHFIISRLVFGTVLKPVFKWLTLHFEMYNPV